MVHPLVHNDQRTFYLMQMRDRILGQYGNAIRVDQLRNTMVDLRVNVVRTSCEDDTAFAGLFQII